MCRNSNEEVDEVIKRYLESFVIIIDDILIRGFIICLSFLLNV